MTTLQIALGLVFLVLLAWLWMSRRASRPDADEIDRIDTLIGWPPQATRVLTTQERVAFATLVKALPEYMILAQVPLARFVSVPKRNSYVDWLRRLGYQCADFVVCDMAAQVVAVVELQASQPTERARKRLTRMARTLKAANIPMQVWSERSLPSADAARDALLPRPMPSSYAAPAAGVAAALAPGATAPTLKSNPFDDTSRDSAHDERIELLEPPPSTWFDDLDSEPVPLRKP